MLNPNIHPLDWKSLEKGSSISQEQVIEFHKHHFPDNEFDDFNWVPYWYPLSVIVSFKEEVYREALNKLRYSFCKEFSNV